MSLIAPNYVSGQYTVAERDRIFSKADQYPDPSTGLANQIPMLTPNGTVIWGNQSSGGETGTANANIAIVEEYASASKDYAVGDLLVYNGTLYRATVAIAAGTALTVGTNIASTTVAMQLAQVVNPDLLINSRFVGGGSQQGGGQFPINQRGQTSYSGQVKTIDSWFLGESRSACNLTANGLELTSSGAAGTNNFDQVIEHPEKLVGQTITFSALVHSATSTATVRITNSSNTNLKAASGTYNGAPFLISATYTIPAGTTSLIANLRGPGGGASAVFVAAKMELGARQTLAHQENGAWVLNNIPDYQTELLRCQRYFQIFRTQSLRPTYGADFRPPMRTAQPTTGTISIGGTTFYTASSEF